MAESKEFRAEFVVAHAKHSLPMQIRDLLDQQEITQTELARRGELPQGTVSRAANPEYGNLTINTLVRIAAGFDVAFIGRFVPFSDFVRYVDEGGELRIPKFTAEYDEHGEPRKSQQEEPVVAVVDTADKTTPRMVTERTGRDAQLYSVEPRPVRATINSRGTADPAMKTGGEYGRR